MSEPLVGVVMGSASDWSTMQAAVAVLERFDVAHEARVVSAHRMPDEMFAYAEQAAPRGLRAIIAGAGGAAHLPGMLAAKTTVPVLGVPVPSRHLQGQDSLLSIVQMPAGVPVATFAIGEAGATNAALFAVAMLAADNLLLDVALRVLPRRAAREAAATALPPPCTIVPPATIGVLGGGQLGRYTVVAARLMGYGTVVLDPDPAAPAGRVADEHLVAAYDDAAAFDHLAARCAVVTTEFENPPAAAMSRLAAAVAVAPAAEAVAIAQDRIREKCFLAGTGRRRRRRSPCPARATRASASRRSSRQPGSGTTARASGRSTRRRRSTRRSPSSPCPASSRVGFHSTSSSA